MKIKQKNFENGFLSFIDNLLAKKWSTSNQKEQKDENGYITLKTFTGSDDENTEQGKISYKVLKGNKISLTFDFSKNKGFIKYVYDIVGEEKHVVFSKLEASGTKKVLKLVLPYKKHLESFAKKTKKL